jgi:hypothetical protein
MSFDFDRPIEIYKFGAAAWPRTILLLIAVAAIGQVLFHIAQGEGEQSGPFKGSADESAKRAATESHHDSVGWYISTFLLLLIPIVYIVAPGLIAKSLSLDKSGLENVKLATAGVLIILYLATMSRNHVGGILTLPILFGAFLDDFGFYTIAPFFILGVTYLMGERRPSRLFAVMIVTYVVLLVLFVAILYVGLPTGNIRPFYDIGTGMVNILQF